MFPIPCGYCSCGCLRSLAELRSKPCPLTIQWVCGHGLGEFRLSKLSPSKWVLTITKVLHCLTSKFSVLKCLVMENFKHTENTEYGTMNCHLPLSQLHEITAAGSCSSIPELSWVSLKHNPGLRVSFKIEASKWVPNHCAETSISPSFFLPHLYFLLGDSWLPRLDSGRNSHNHT